MMIFKNSVHLLLDIEGVPQYLREKVVKEVYNNGRLSKAIPL